MIRINLLKPLQAQRPMVLVEERKGGKAWLWILLLAALLGGGYWGYGQWSASREGAPSSIAAAPESEAPKPTPAVPKRVTADAVEEIVRAVRTEGAAAPPEYPDLAPSQRIAFQHLAGKNLLRDLQAATPADVGFARVIFTPPGEFYLHGLAASEGDLKRFQAALAALPGAELRQSLARPVGGGKSSWEFSFFGKVKYPAAAVAQTANRVHAREKMEAELRTFESLAKESGVELRSPRLQNSSTEGGLRRMLYRAEAHCDYARLTALLEKLEASRSGVGLLRIALEAKGDEKMLASLDLLVYAQ